jgi:hypothetical protein
MQKATHHTRHFRTVEINLANLAKLGKVVGATVANSGSSLTDADIGISPNATIRIELETVALVNLVNDDLINELCEQHGEEFIVPLVETFHRKLNNSIILSALLT